MFGVSSIYIIFEEKVDFYWSRSRVLEKLNSLSSNLLPDGVNPSLGPDATALGQVYWYTIEGRDPEGNVTGGWDLPELRSVQDYYVKYALNGVSGVSEVASVGGYVREYQVDVNPDALKAYNIGIEDYFYTDAWCLIEWPSVIKNLLPLITNNIYFKNFKLGYLPYATAKLIEKVGGDITGFAFIVELTELNGIKGLSKYNCKSLVKY